MTYKKFSTAQDTPAQNADADKPKDAAPIGEPAAQPAPTPAEATPATKK